MNNINVSNEHIMKTVKIILYIVVLFISMSCKFLNNETCEIIEISSAINKKTGIPLTNVAKSISYVQLETNDSCLIRKIEQIKMYQERIYIQNEYKELIVFDINGGFELKIGESGKGPGEYLTIDDFAIDEKRELIYIFDQTQSKVLCFTLNGNLCNEKYIEEYPLKLELTDDNFTFLYYFTNEFPIRIFKDNVLLQSVSRKTFQLDRFKVNDNYRSSFYTFNDTASFWHDHNNYLYRISSSKVFKAYFFDFGKNLITNNDKRKRNYADNIMKAWIGEIVETTNFLFIKAFYNKVVMHLLYDKNKKELIHVYTNECSNNQYFMNMALENDIDETINFWPDSHGKVNDSTLFRSFYAYSLKNVNDFCLDKSRIIEKMDISLANIVEKSEVEDNPVLMIVNMK